MHFPVVHFWPYIHAFVLPFCCGCDAVGSASEMTYIVSSGALNSTHSLTTPSVLRDLHWLRAPQRIDYKIAVLVYRCLHGLAPAYLSVDQQRIKDLPSRHSDYGHGCLTR